MKIAYVVPYVPNLIRTRSYNLISQLVKLGHEVTVFTVGSGEQEWQDSETLRAKVTHLYYQDQPVRHSLLNSVKAVPTRRPLQTVYSWNRSLANVLVKCISDDPGIFDIVHVEHLRGSRYGQHVKSKLAHIPVVWDSVDCISHLFEQASARSTALFGRLIARLELDRTRIMEGNLLNCFDHVVVTSSVDREALLNLAKNGMKPAPVSVLSNGVDQEFFHPNPVVQRDSETLVFSGKMSYHANISMVKHLVAEIMPRIWRVNPKVRLYIVGKDPSSEIKELGKNPLIEVTGTVDDIRPFLWRATVSVVPLLYGAGIQNKILEAMATRTPVVTTSKALTSLSARAGKHLLAANNPDEFSSAVLKLIEDRNLRGEIGENGESYIKTHHNWNSIAAQLGNIYQQTLNFNRML